MLAKLTIPAGRSYKFCTMMMMEACHLVGTSTAGQTTFDFSTYGKIISGAGGELVILDNSKAGNWTPYTDWHNVDNFTTSGINYNPWFTMYTATDKADEAVAFVQMVGTSTNSNQTANTSFSYNIGYQPQIVVGTAPSTQFQHLNPNSPTVGWRRIDDGAPINSSSANASHIHIVPNHSNDWTQNMVMWNFHQTDNSPNAGNSTKTVMYISINSEQFTIYQLPFDGTTDNDYEANNHYWGGAIFHYGTRTTQGWEDGYSDNPSWTMLNFYKWQHLDRGGYWTRMRQNNPWSTPSTTTVSLNASLITGTQGRNPISNQKFYSGSFTSTRTSYDGGGDAYYDKVYPQVAYQGTDTRYTTGSGWTNATSKTVALAESNWGTNNIAIYESSLKLQMPFFRGVNESATPGGSGNNQSYAATVPVVDPNTGLTAPPAMPIMIQAANGNNAGGQLKGLMYGGHLPNASYLDSVRTKEAKYNINGNLFIPIHFNPPNWSGSTQYSTQRGVDIMWLGV